MIEILHKVPWIKMFQWDHMSNLYAQYDLNLVKCQRFLLLNLVFE
jgi:hypothetical protein